jgi:hypothetical protein
MGVWYATREEVKSAMENKTTRSDRRIDRAIESSSRSIEGKLHRRFYPWTGTRHFDWPNYQRASVGRLWLDDNELVSLTAVVSGSLTISTANVFLRRADDKDEPPYSFIELDRSSVSPSFSTGNTAQRSLGLTGVYAGCAIDEETVGTVAEVLDASETGVDIADSSVVGVGSILRVDTERMIVTARSMLDTGQTVQTDALTASNNNTTVKVTSGAAFNVSEIILIDSERMSIEDIAGNSLTVKRAVDGSTLAAHNTGTTIYAPRTLTVTRGALGTTAATHLTAAPLYRFIVPGPVNTLCIAYTINQIEQQGAGYARTAGTGDNEKDFTGRGIAAAERDAIMAYGRQMRTGAI